MSNVKQKSHFLLRHAARQWDPRLRIVVVFWLALAVVDVYQRLLVFEVGSSNGDAVDALPSLVSASDFDENKYRGYLQKLSENEVKRIPDGEAGGLLEDAVTEPLLDEGVLPKGESWQVGRYSYTLLAILQNNGRFAVLDRRADDGERTLLEVRVGDQIDKYVVDTITDRIVSAGWGSKDRMELALFEP